MLHKRYPLLLQRGVARECLSSSCAISLRRSQKILHIILNSETLKRISKKSLEHFPDSTGTLQNRADHILYRLAILILQAGKDSAKAWTTFSTLSWLYTVHSKILLPALLLHAYSS